MTNPQEKSELTEFLENVEDLYLELWRENRIHWGYEFKIEKDESMLYKHIHLTPREKPYIISYRFEDIIKICIKHEENLEITLSIEVRPFELAMPDNRYFMVQQPSIDIQISKPE